YGMTEFSSQMATSAIWTQVQAHYTCGKPITGLDLVLSDVGEIRAKGPSLFMGYLSQGGITKEVDPDGWFDTGDLGRFENDELLFLGRKDAMFISGGENIQPEEIEAVLLEMSGIRRATVVPVEDADFGFRPVAILDWEGERSPTTEVEKRLAEHIPKFKIPIAFLDWPQETGAGGVKVHRQRLRTFARQSLGAKDDV
ncbi:MAG: AMP-binding protein, partial [Rhodothermales bacterium]|nr:AMP-binding protein [Rhodothermales bacterium]